MSYFCKFTSGDVKFTVGGSREGNAGVRTALNFNPSGNSDVERVKAFMTAVTQEVMDQKDKHDDRADDPLNDPDWRHSKEAMRCFDQALLLLETASMFAVKGVIASKNSFGE